MCSDNQQQQTERLRSEPSSTIVKRTSAAVVAVFAAAFTAPEAPETEAAVTAGNSRDAGLSCSSCTCFSSRIVLWWRKRDSSNLFCADL